MNMTSNQETSTRITEFLSLGKSTMSEYKDNRSLTSNKREKSVPLYGQNLLALEPLPGMEYALDWLKFEKLHKYWPMISRFSYHQLINLNADNWEATVSSVGVYSPHAVTFGAKMRFLRMASQLRSRSSRLKEALRSESLQVILREVASALRTPLADAPEVDGEKLIPLIRLALTVVLTKARSIDLWMSAARLHKILDLHLSLAKLYAK